MLQDDQIKCDLLSAVYMAHEERSEMAAQFSLEKNTKECGLVKGLG
jgi:hypothetical protein